MSGAIVRRTAFLDIGGFCEDLHWRANGMIRHPGKAPLVDVTGIPWPHRNWHEDQDVTPIITRRGCTSACGFCAMVPFYDRDLGPVVRYREVRDVVDEIEHCVEHGRLELMFHDSPTGGRRSRPKRSWSLRSRPRS